MNCLVRLGHAGQRAADLGSGRVAIGMQNARNRMGRFARTQKVAAVVVESRAPLDQFFHPQRALGNQHLGGAAIHQPIAGGDRVFQMERDIFAALHRHRDAALRIMRVRFVYGFLGDHQHLAVNGQFHRRPQSRNARSYHHKVRLHVPTSSLFRLHRCGTRSSRNPACATPRPRRNL